MIYITSFFYCFLSSGLYFSTFYREDTNLLMSTIVPFVLLLPILLSAVNSRPNITLINLTAIFAFAMGLILGGNSNIWPFALGAWLALSVPAIIAHNVAALIYIKTHNYSSNLTDAENATPS